METVMNRTAEVGAGAISEPVSSSKPNGKNAIGKGNGGDLSNTPGSQRMAQPAQPEPLIPPVDIFEDEAGITLIADLPGVPRDRLEIKVTGDNLLIEATAAVPQTGEVELLYGEVSSPKYRRSFTLSHELDPGRIEAKLKSGVLKLHIPKAEEAKPRRIEISVG
jgi:HSP20 family protein